MNRRLCVAIVMSLVIVGGLGPAGAIAVPSASTQDAQPATIDSELTSASGEQTVIVRLTEQSPAAISAASHDDRINQLQSHAAATRSDFKTFADETPYVEINREFWVSNALVVTVDTDRVPLQQLADVDNVERIHPNYEVEAAETAVSSPPTASPAGQSTPAAPQLSTTDEVATTTVDTTYGLDLLNVPTAWEHTKGDGATIAVIDTGVDPDHPDIDIDPANWNDWDTDGSERFTSPQDYGNHGTHVSGTAVGGSAGGAHIGVAPEAELYHGAALNQNCDTRCTGTVAQIIAGMEWAVEEDVDIISMSLGGGDYIDELSIEVRNAQAAGTVVVAAAGNDGAGTSISPGNVYDAISVGASDQNDNIAAFSSSETISADDWNNPPADWPDEYTVPTIVAPGDGTISSVPGGEYAAFDGTSMATPHVAGTIALMKASSSDELSPAEIKSILEATAVDTGDTDVRQGAGRIDAAAAVAEVSDDSDTTGDAVFEIASFSASPEVTAGETVTLTATLANTGQAAGEQTVSFVIDGTTVASETVSIQSGGTTTIQDISYQTDESDVGELHSTVNTDDDTATATTTVLSSTHESGVDQKLWDAVTDQNGPADTLTYQDLIDVIDRFHETGSIDGIAIEYDDLLNLIEYYETT